MSKGEYDEQGEDENSLKSEAPISTFLGLPSTTISISSPIILLGKQDVFSGSKIPKSIGIGFASAPPPK